MLTVFTVTMQGTTFAEFNLCGYIMIQTEHSELLILEIRSEGKH